MHLGSGWPERGCPTADEEVDSLHAVRSSPRASRFVHRAYTNHAIMPANKSPFTSSACCCCLRLNASGSHIANAHAEGTNDDDCTTSARSKRVCVCVHRASTVKINACRCRASATANHIFRKIGYKLLTLTMWLYVGAF